MVMDALSFCQATLYEVRCPQGPYYINIKRYPLEPRSISEAIRKRRLDLNLRQVDAAKGIGCNEMTIVNWEKGHTRPRRKKYSAIRTFLGALPKEWLVWFGA
jgi:DNA-binding XRE family transcriptional regulator